MAQAFFGGVHPDGCKSATARALIEQLPPPSEVAIAMRMHLGAPCVPTVQIGDHVDIGQKIGETQGLGAPIHTGVSGTVKAIEPRPDMFGTKTLSVVIENDFANTVSEEVKPPEEPDLLSTEEMIDRIREAGIVGMGGATFPTHVKIESGIGKVHTVIINGAECEPYLTCDHRTMLENAEEIIGGAQFLAKIFGVNKVIIGVETNKRNAIVHLRKVIEKMQAPVVVHPLHPRYPQGGEKQICQAITGREVPPGALPSAIGCAVFNINTTVQICRALVQGMPLVNKVVTVSGSGVIKPRNILCPIGTPISALLDYCGGVRESTYKIVVGGPMMGMAQYTTDLCVTKGTGGVLAFCGHEEKTVKEPKCIRCGRCVEACPMHLEPLFLYQFAMRNRYDDLRKHHVLDCLECGACSYICPGRLNLTQAFKVAKQRVKDDTERKVDQLEAAEKEARA